MILIVHGLKPGASSLSGGVLIVAWVHGASDAFKTKLGAIGAFVCLRAVLCLVLSCPRLGHVAAQDADAENLRLRHVRLRSFCVAPAFRTVRLFCAVSPFVLRACLCAICTTEP